MRIKLANLVLPAFLATVGSLPASAEIRIGVDLPNVHIRIAPDAPPPPRVEVRVVRPGPDYVWIDGYWDRREERWAWLPGRWERPSRRGVVWVRPRYLREGGCYRYEPAHWSHQRMEEGEDYRRWRHDHGPDRPGRPLPPPERHEHDHDHDRGHDHGRGWGWGRHHQD